MHLRTVFLLLPMTTAASAQSIAQDIIVRAPNPIDREETRSRINSVVHASAGSNQIGRFVDPICPAVYGLPDRFADIVATKIRAVAGEIHAPLAKLKCKPNLIVLITNDPREFIMSVNNKGVLDGLGKSRREQLLTGEFSAEAWSRTEVRNEDGSRKQPNTLVQNTNGGQWNMGSRLPTRSASIIKMSSQTIIYQSVVVFNEKALIGRTLSQIADYAAMRTFGDTGSRSISKVTFDSILTLFDNTNPPKGLTEFDRKFLEALYRSSSTQNAGSQLNQIADLITKH